MLKGGFTANRDIKANFHFSSNNTDAELWVDSVSLMPFTKLEWQAHQNKMIEQVRKRKVKIHVETRDGHKLPGAKINIDQTRPKFLIGSGSAETILTNKAYQDYFTARFTAVTPHNELKWYFTENFPDHENYTVPDAMVAFFKKHKIAIRGHTVLWADTNRTQWWVKQMQPRDILKAAIRRVGSVVSRYSGDIIGWDVMNENLHNSFYEEKLGPNASAMIYQIVHAMDPNTPLFLNEYNTMELPTDPAVIPSKYVAKYREMRAFPGNENLPVYFGLQGHFYRRPMVSHIRAVFDILGATGMKIWITELDTLRGPLQAVQLEEVMREAYSHPAVEGIIVWGGWKPKGCAEMCLVDNNFKNLPPGDVVDKLIKEWKTTDVKGVTDENGVFEHDVFLGEYTLTFTHPSIARFGTKTFNVPSGEGPLELRVCM
ncbi:endo-1 4-beta-xylanase 2 [Phtheirospermum japonicum]|uniref:Endo-1 4-beta-xylanase 2 n=1 Tax=Phtheirospermum japonicum TaxID=374723 RepID=A0A830BHE0_9LAMI|nr:endo-1 4-beta-xylanase 2 [Phtheirospermum japonicum]